jgi:hypothetical protein
MNACTDLQAKIFKEAGCVSEKVKRVRLFREVGKIGVKT